MSKGVSVHIGLNHVDAAAYGGWDGALAGCVDDAHDLTELANAEGYRTTTLTDRVATTSAILGAVREAAGRLDPGDAFLLTYSGHGSQLPDHDTGSEHGEPLGYDETWTCWDRQLLDDELHAALGTFAPGVRVVVVSDSCHGGTVARHPHAPSPPVRTLDGARRARLMPAGVAAADGRRRLAAYDRARRNARAELRRSMAARRVLTRRAAMMRKPMGGVQTRVVLLAGCQENQVSYDGPANGAFTAALLAVWRRGGFDGSLPEYLSAVRSRLSSQTPVYSATGPGDAAWEACRPFTIDLDDELRLVDLQSPAGAVPAVTPR